MFYDNICLNFSSKHYTNTENNEPKAVLNLCVKPDVIHFGLTQKQKQKIELNLKKWKKQKGQKQSHFASSTLT